VRGQPERGRRLAVRVPRDGRRAVVDADECVDRRRRQPEPVAVPVDLVQAREERALEHLGDVPRLVVAHERVVRRHHDPVRRERDAAPAADAAARVVV